MLIDTDIIIHYMRGNEKARQFIESHPGFYYSAVTYMELVQGMRDKAELRLLKRALRRWKASVIYIDQEISSKAMHYVEQLYLSHSVELADALIAATATSKGFPLASGNYKHYKVNEGLEFVRFQR